MVCFISHPNLNAQEQLEASYFKALEYRNIGPTRGGRATAVAGDKDNPGVFYMGATGGGVWKSTDFGHNWRNISDGYFKTPSIGAIRLAPTDSKIIYVGTGSDGIRSNVIAGKGVYKSVDAGKTWQNIGLEKTGQIGAIEIHPNDPNTVYVAAIGEAFAPNSERGVYRTRDGGRNWEKILFVSDTTGAVDLEFAPNNPDIIYASMWRGERKPWTIISGGKEGGVYKSTDGGDNWKKITNGLPTDIIGKSDLAVSPADPNKVYALVEAPEDTKQGGLYVSDDQGENFRLVSTYAPLLDRPFYYCNVDADPNNADILFVNSTRFFKSDNGGKSWKRMSTPHGDNHDIWIHPDNSDIWVQANDGGVNVTRDGGKTWSTQHNQSTAELYQVEVDDQFPYWLYAGQQDNSTIALPSLPPYNSVSGGPGYWMAVGGCETGPVVPKPGNPDIVYANCKGRFGVFNKKTGQEQQFYVGASNMYGHNPKELKFRFQRVAPIHVSSHNPDVVYHTSQFVHKTTDDGKTWEIISPDLTAFEDDKQVISGSPITRDVTGEEFYSTIYAIQESKIKEGLIWVGANDGPVHVTTNGGDSWNKVTPGEMQKGGRIDCVAPSPHKEAKAYVCGLRYQLGDWKPYIYKTENYGESWTLLTDGKNGIPADYPVRVVREDPDREGVLYAGTEYGLYISFNDGDSWTAFQQNLPVTPITDIKVYRKDLIASTMGRGFWIMDDLSAIHQMNEQNIQSSAHLFQPRDAHRMRYRRTSQSSVPYYPGPSVIIDYNLKEKVDGEIVIDILDKDKKLVRSFTNIRNKKANASISEPDMATGFFRQGFSPEIKAGAGLHRIRWDMRHVGPWSNSSGNRPNNGPMVAPGQYFVRLSAAGKEMTQSFNILPDPRVIKNGISIEDMMAQEDLCLKVRSLQSEANQLLESAKKGKVNSKTKAGSEAADDILKALQTANGRYMKPQLLAQLSYLRSMLDRADQRPGKDAYDRYTELETQLKKLSAKWKEASDDSRTE